MKLIEVLAKLDSLAKENNISKPYIVGGLPRDKTMGLTAIQVQDIDITTGEKDSLGLAMAASKEWEQTHFRMYDDGHSSLAFKNIQIDFSNNFLIPGIKEELEKMGITNPAQLQKEIYSRDFTINTLLLPLDMSEIIDITGKGIEDCKNKILRTPINPELTIGYDPRRILRALKFTIKFNLTIDKELEEALLKYRGNVKDIPLNHIKKQINEMLAMNADKTMELLTKYKLLPIIPLSKLMRMEVLKRKMIQDILD